MPIKTFYIFGDVIKKWYNTYVGKKKVNKLYFFFMMIFCFSQFQSVIGEVQHNDELCKKLENSASEHFCSEATISKKNSEKSSHEDSSKNIPSVCHHHCLDHLVYFSKFDFVHFDFPQQKIEFLFKDRKLKKFYLELVRPPSYSYIV